jgi:hypothetical protein
MAAIEDFLRDIDAHWTPPRPAPLTLRILGSTALLLQTHYRRGTKDSDVLETPEITPAVNAALLRLGRQRVVHLVHQHRRGGRRAVDGGHQLRHGERLGKRPA